MYLDNPSGGFKVVYEYANRLQRRDHLVSVVHPRNQNQQKGLVEAVKSVGWPYKLKLKHQPLIDWFDVDPGVRLLLTPDLRAEFIPDGDAVFATALDTAVPVSQLPASKGRKFYLIQSWEDWNGPESLAPESWRLPMQKIVISNWLMQIARDLGEEARTTRIPIGMDFSRFKITAPIEERRTPRVGLLAHPNEVKGTKDGVAALEIVKQELSELQAAVFGTHPRAADLPSWMEYAQRPAPEQLAALYNSCQAYLHPSWSEGWGLTAAEAMACGCALVTTDNGGVNEFATDGESALFAPVKSPEALARQLIRVLGDDDLRRRLAHRGSEQVRQFTWDRAVDALENLLLESR